MISFNKEPPKKKQKGNAEVPSIPKDPNMYPYLEETPESAGKSSDCPMQTLNPKPVTHFSCHPQLEIATSMKAVVPAPLRQGCNDPTLRRPKKSTWMVVKIMVPFWAPVIIRHLIFRVPKKGP